MVAVRVGGEIVQWNIAAEVLRGGVLGAAEVRRLSDLVSPEAAVGLRSALVAGTGWRGVVALVGRDSKPSARHDGDSIRAAHP